MNAKYYAMFNTVVSYQGADYIVVSVIPAQYSPSRKDTFGIEPIADYWVGDGSNTISVRCSDVTPSSTPFPPQPGLERLRDWL
jgi:hypothetical protein